MIVRTYARRSRCDDHDGGADSLTDSEPIDVFSSQELSQDPLPFNVSSQGSSPWSLPPLPSSSPPRQQRKRRRTKEQVGPTASAAPSSTLMEAQEFGEMMEHVDEVNFALDGLRPRQPARIRRASLVSLLGICGTLQRRRLLRSQGMAKRIIDAILGLNIDDSPSTVAAAALFFVLASDGQNDNLLDSPSCIKFLLKILDPKLTDTIADKIPTVGSKLLGILKPQATAVTNKEMDSSSRKVISKVQELLLDCKEIKCCSLDEDGIERPELTSKWISLLTMEKACLSTVSLEDTLESVKNVGGNFKERLRELGGLDAVFGVMVSCHSMLERWLNEKILSAPELKDGNYLESVVLLLKCLKIMENATFLSKDNQDHLLNMRGKLNSEGLYPSFVGIVINCTKLLSDLSLHQGRPSIISIDNSSSFTENTNVQNNASNPQMNIIAQDKHHCDSTAEDVLCSGIDYSHEKMSTASHKSQKLSDSPSELSASCSEMTLDVNSEKENSNGGSCQNAKGLKLNISRNSLKVNFNANGLKMKSDNSGERSHGWISIRATGSNSNSRGSHRITGSKADSDGPFKRPKMSEDTKSESIKDSFDPFAFDEEESKPSKWEKVARKKEKPKAHQREVTNKEHVGRDSVIACLPEDPSSSQSINGDSQSQTLESSSFSVDEDINLMQDCLLTSVKVLMNLTNDNPDGCQQIASCGGLDTMATLIISHFPSFDLCSPMHSQQKVDVPSSSQSSTGLLNNKHLSDYELDFLVAILGLLVNLVEKDSGNRLQLASAGVVVEISGRSERRDAIPLLCSIFLAKRGAGEAAGEQRRLQCEHEESPLVQGEREAENMIIEAYAALVLAFLSTESGSVREDIARYLPDHNLQALVPVLERFVAFHFSLNMMSKETHSTVTKVIEACKQP